MNGRQQYHWKIEIEQLERLLKSEEIKDDGRHILGALCLQLEKAL